MNKEQNFEIISKTAALLSKNYAEEFLRLLVLYKDISASEAASRLDMHIKTAQDFLEELAELGIADKILVTEKTRPYYRYSLKQSKITIEVDLSKLVYSEKWKDISGQKIKEKKNSGIMFTHSAGGQMISGLTIYTGEGRFKKEQKINLSESQGKFLFYLPFPTEQPKTISAILEKAGLNKSYLNEIMDIIDVLEKHNALEITA